jgi:hypothetical protein
MLTVAKAFVEEQKERERRKKERKKERRKPFMKRVTFGTRKSEKC